MYVVNKYSENSPDNWCGPWAGHKAAVAAWARDTVARTPFADVSVPPCSRSPNRVDPSVRAVGAKSAKLAL